MKCQVRPDAVSSIRGVWRSGVFGKLICLGVSFIAVLMIDATPRYARFLSARVRVAQTQSIPFILPDSMFTYSSLNRDTLYSPKLLALVREIRDSLLATGARRAANMPVPFEMLALRTDFQLSDALAHLDDAPTALILDARLECSCDVLGYFHLVRFQVEEHGRKVTVLRDEQVSWSAYVGKYLPLRAEI